MKQVCMNTLTCVSIDVFLQDSIREAVSDMDA